MNEKEELTRKLQAAQFALVDLGLYLDSHPNDTEALKTYRGLTEDARTLKREYEQNFGSLTAGSGCSGDYWDWTATPFPWEIC